ncbi:septum formation family protein [Pseudarthrobacter sp. NPDC058362]|uniref:septum formation family protein n=1 Tax=Pseudarthrobacter sp. NPDC058362 TaxID=3346458 RepID=UPI00364DC690
MPKEDSPLDHQDVPPTPETPSPPHTPADGPLPEEPAPHRPGSAQQTFWKVFFVVVLAAVIGSLVWLAIWLNSNADSSSAKDIPGVLETVATAPATPLPLPRTNVNPGDYALGDCFKDFDPEALKSTVVACNTSHSAQLVAVFRYPEKESYPGAEVLKAKALEACQATKLGPAADKYTLNYERSYPSTTSWESGDRRVDCYVTAPGGNVIKASVLP